MLLGDTRRFLMGKSKRRLKKRLNRSRQRKSQKHKGRTPGRNHHHLQNKCKGGNSSPSNLLLIDIEKHRCWHALFKNKDLGEVIELLLRIRRLKQGRSK